MASGPLQTSVRQMLATRTRKVHENLHVHPWIASLAKPGLTISRYGVVLGAYHDFYHHLEQSCSNHPLPECLSLRPARERLSLDLNSLAAVRLATSRPCVELTIDDPVELLGALYVLHGASFGARILNRNVRIELPDAPRHFLESSTAGDAWQPLIAELEAFANNELAREKLTHGAKATFVAFGTFVTRFCESELDQQVQKQSGMQ